jgi:hypothetical protein
MPKGPGTAPAPAASLTITFPPPNANNKIVVHNVKIGSAPSVDFVNNTGDLVRLWIPRGDQLFAALASGQDFNDLAIKDGGKLSLIVLGTPTYGTYPYHIFCKLVDDYARGGSPPTLSCP